MSEIEETGSSSNDPVLPIPAPVGAVVGAVLGAGFWAGLLIVANMEHGIVAWGVGWLVGIGAYLGKGRNAATGMLCGVLALASIFGGKFVGTAHARQAAIDEVASEGVDRGTYQGLVEQARALPDLETDTDLRGFLISTGRSDARAVPDVTESEIEGFELSGRPELEAIASGDLTYEVWSGGRSGVARAVIEANMPSTADLVVESLGALDLLFLALGVYSAVKVGGATGGAGAPARRRRGRRTGGAARRAVPPEDGEDPAASESEDDGR